MFWWKNLVKAVAPVVNVVNTIVQGVADKVGKGWFSEAVQNVTHSVNQAVKPSSAAHTGSNQQGRPKPTASQQQGGGAKAGTGKNKARRREKADRDEALFRHRRKDMDNLPQDIAEQEESYSFGEGIGELGTVDLSPIRMISTMMNSPVVRSVSNMNTTMLSIFNGMVQGHNGNIAKAVENFFADHYAEDVNPEDVQSIQRILSDLDRRQEVEMNQMMGLANEAGSSFRGVFPLSSNRPKESLNGGRDIGQTITPTPIPGIPTVEATEESENGYVDPCMKADNKTSCYLDELDAYGITIGTTSDETFKDEQLQVLLKTANSVGVYLLTQVQENKRLVDYHNMTEKEAFREVLGGVAFIYDPSLEGEPGLTQGNKIRLNPTGTFYGADGTFYEDTLIPAHELGHIFQNRRGVIGEKKTIYGFEDLPADTPYTAIDYATVTDPNWVPGENDYDPIEPTGNLELEMEEDSGLFFNEPRSPEEGFSDAFAAATMRGEAILRDDVRGTLFMGEAHIWVENIIDPSTFNPYRYTRATETPDSSSGFDISP